MDDASQVRDWRRHCGWNDESGELTVCLPAIRTIYGAQEGVRRLSDLAPLQRYVKNAMDWRKKIAGGDYLHPKDGFDIVLHDSCRWTLFMSVDHTMQIWDCRSDQVESEEGDEICNHWRLRSEFWIPWRGQFFIVKLRQADAERLRRDYVLVRDCGEVYELNTYPPDGEWHGRPVLRGGPPNTYHEGGTWHGDQLLDPVDYLIAILYVEPEHRVYGFGPTFYVRLDAPTASLEKTHCRDVTQGNAILTDDNGETHELGEPYRTIWQCAKVLKEDGVLEAATETETKPQDGEAMPAATRRTESQAGNGGRSNLPE